MNQDSYVPVLTYPVERYKGKVEVSLLGEDGMHLRSATDHPLTINGVTVYFNINVKEYDGEWELVRYLVRGTGGHYPDWSALTVRRVDNFESASQSANKKVLELAEDLAQWVADDRPEAVIQGEVHRLRRKRDLLSDERITLEARLAQIRNECSDLSLSIEGQRVRWATEVALQEAQEIALKEETYRLEGGNLSLEVTSHL